MRRPWHTSGCCAVGGLGWSWGEIVLLEKVNIENNTIEFFLNRVSGATRPLVATLLLFWGVGLKRNIYNTHLLN